MLFEYFKHAVERNGQNKAAYQKFRKLSLEGSLLTDLASDIASDTSSVEQAFSILSYPAGDQHISILNCQSIMNSQSAPYSSPHHPEISRDYIINYMTIIFNFGLSKTKVEN